MTKGLPRYRTLIASINKYDIGNAAAGSVSRSEVELAMDSYYELGYRLFSATPVQDAGDAVTVMYVLQLND
jgi:hypothetical protein